MAAYFGQAQTQSLSPPSPSVAAAFCGDTKAAYCFGRWALDVNVLCLATSLRAPDRTGNAFLADGTGGGLVDSGLFFRWVADGGLIHVIALA